MRARAEFNARDSRWNYRKHEHFGEGAHIRGAAQGVQYEAVVEEGMGFWWWRMLLGALVADNMVASGSGG